MKLITYLFFLVVAFQLPAQDSLFTGQIMYRFEFNNPKTGADITTELASFLGVEQHYYVNSKNYMAFNEKETLTQLYNSESNKYYLVNPINREVSEINAEESSSEIIEITHLEGSDTIAGFYCKQMIIRTDKDEITYWYTPLLRVPWENYRNHIYGNWGVYLKATNGALPLKYIVKAPLYTMTSTAYSVKNLKLTEKNFDIKAMLSGE